MQPMARGQKTEMSEETRFMVPPAGKNTLSVSVSNSLLPPGWFCAKHLTDMLLKP